MKALLIYIPAILAFIVLSMHVVFNKYRVLPDNFGMGTYVAAAVFISFCIYFYILNVIFLYISFTELKRMILSAAIPVILFGVVSVIDIVKPPSGIIAFGWKHVLLLPGAEITNLITRYLR